jgi:flavin reductase (NADH)
MLSDISSSFRNILKGLVYPVCVASCKGSDLTNHAITVSSVTSVSFEPASLLVCINSDSSMSNAIDEKVKLNISFLHSSQKNIAELCSNPASKIRRFDNSYWDFDLNANPYIKDAQGVAFLLY